MATKKNTKKVGWLPIWSEVNIGDELEIQGNPFTCTVHGFTDDYQLILKVEPWIERDPIITNHYANS